MSDGSTRTSLRLWRLRGRSRHRTTTQGLLRRLPSPPRPRRPSPPKPQRRTRRTASAAAQAARTARACTSKRDGNLATLSMLECFMFPAVPPDDGLGQPQLLGQAVHLDPLDHVVPHENPQPGGPPLDVRHHPGHVAQVLRSQSVVGLYFLTVWG